MRCPKCGFISFDHLDFCRKCKKPLGSVAVMLRGSVCDCHAPMFLRFSQQPQEVDEMEGFDSSLHGVIEEVEIEAPDLDAMRGPDPLPAQLAKASAPAAAPKAAINTPVRPVAESGAAVAQAFSPSSASRTAASFFDDLEVADDPDQSEEEPAALALPREAMELPPDLADMSDLAPPRREVEFTAVEGDDDLDLNLDLDLGFDLQDLQDTEEYPVSPGTQPKSAAAPASRRGQAGSVDMDSDLDFELDLGGLSLHDHDDNRK